MKLLYILIWIILQDWKLFGCGLVGLCWDLAASTFPESLVKRWFFFFLKLGLCASPSPLLSFFFLPLSSLSLAFFFFFNEEPFHEHFAQSTELLLKSARRSCNRQQKGKRLPEIRTPASPPRPMVKQWPRGDREVITMQTVPRFCNNQEHVDTYLWEEAWGKHCFWLLLKPAFWRWTAAQGNEGRFCKLQILSRTRTVASLSWPAFPEYLKRSLETNKILRTSGTVTDSVLLLALNSPSWGRSPISWSQMSIILGRLNQEYMLRRKLFQASPFTWMYLHSPPFPQTPTLKPRCWEALN